MTQYYQINLKVIMFFYLLSSCNVSTLEELTSNETTQKQALMSNLEPCPKDEDGDNTKESALLQLAASFMETEESSTKESTVDSEDDVPVIPCQITEESEEEEEDDSVANSDMEEDSEDGEGSNSEEDDDDDEDDDEEEEEEEEEKEQEDVENDDD